MKRSLVQKLGLLGILSFLSYTAAVVFSPLAYPGYNLDGAGGQRSKRGKRALARTLEPAQRAL